MGAGASNRGTWKSTLDIIILALLLAAAVHKYETPTPSTPLWMGRLEEVQPEDAFRLGFLLLGVFPSDILTSIAVGGSASA